MQIQESLTTPVRGKYDAVVVGAGPAGCGAAIAMGRRGLRVLLIESHNCPGGSWTTGFINPLFDYKGKTGILQELVEELNAKGQFGGFWNMSFHYEYMKLLLEEKLRAAGVEVLYNTHFSRTLFEGNTVTGIVAENIEGRFAALSDMVVDGTGDGKVAASAGCAFLLGEDGDYKQCQAMTLMFLVGNIPEKYRDGFMMYEKLNAVYEKGGKILPFKVPYLIPVPNAHFGVIQFTHMYECDPLSADALTAATQEGRRQLIEAFELLRTYDPEFRDLELITSADMLGVRESRRIVGEYTVSTEDILSGSTFPDAVAYCTFGADLHTKSNKGQVCFSVKPYQIPLRALLPKGYCGIVVAGRCISGTREAMASYRVTGNCIQMGENAGYYIAEALQTKQDIRDVRLQLPLRVDGTCL